MKKKRESKTKKTGVRKDFSDKNCESDKLGRLVIQFAVGKNETLWVQIYIAAIAPHNTLVSVILTFFFQD